MDSSRQKSSSCRVKITILDDKTLSNNDRLGAIGDLFFAVQQRHVNGDFIVFGGDNLFDHGFGHFIEFAKKSKIKVALNPSSSQLKLGLEGLKDVLGTVDVLLLNQEEGAKLAGLPFEQEKEIFKRLDEYVKGIVIMTKGPAGVVVSDGEYIYEAGTFKEKKYIDRTGAGDAFGAGFVSGLMRYGTIEEAIRLGAANGTAVVEALGAKNGLLTKLQFETELRWKDLKM